MSAPDVIDTFAPRLLAWQRQHGRHDLPWQQTRDPYRVWLSEIMLQQTQVATVIPYYQRFLDRYPTVAALAAAPQAEVLELWAGLGYYARARNLHACAIAVVEKHGGRFPDHAATLATLPGIGRSTAAAIASFCHGERAAILDGNVKRVLCRHFGIDGFPGSTAVEKQLWTLAEQLLPASSDMPTYSQGIMDLGATLCSRGQPNCPACPMRDTCVALATGRTVELPVAKPRKATPVRQASVLVCLAGDRVLLERRPPVGIWGGLLALPEALPDESPTAACARLGLRCADSQPLPGFRHTFSHFHLDLSPSLCRVEPTAVVMESALEWLSLADIDTAALPAPVKKLLQTLPPLFL
jgi:A/G-specific adenine glycosylase